MLERMASQQQRREVGLRVTHFDGNVESISTLKPVLSSHSTELKGGNPHEGAAIDRGCQ